MLKQIMEAKNATKRFLKLLFLTMVLFGCVSFSFAQTAGVLTVIATQGIHFGTICATGTGGTVTLGYDGTRTPTGNILLLPVAPIAQPAIFEIKLCGGTGLTVAITYDATVTLYSDAGSLIMDIGPTDKGTNGASFTTNSDCNIPTLLRVGGTLHIPANPVPGIYTGSFAITFNQQ